MKSLKISTALDFDFHFPFAFDFDSIPCRLMNKIPQSGTRARRGKEHFSVSDPPLQHIGFDNISFSVMTETTGKGALASSSTEYVPVRYEDASQQQKEYNSALEGLNSPYTIPSCSAENYEYGFRQQQNQGNEHNQMSPVLPMALVPGRVLCDVSQKREGGMSQVPTHYKEKEAYLKPLVLSQAGYFNKPAQTKPSKRSKISYAPRPGRKTKAQKQLEALDVDELELENEKLKHELEHLEVQLQQLRSELGLDNSSF